MAKKEQVTNIFNTIAGSYDKLNHILSLNIDKIWRKRAIKIVKQTAPKNLLDVACGTCDFTIAALRSGLNNVTGIDISSEMLKIGEIKVRKMKGVRNCELRLEDSENMSFENNSFDAITVAFGVRNFENLEKGLAEFYRVLAPGKKLVILEFSKPNKFPIKQFYNFYFKHILPNVGGFISGNKAAYEYLPQSVYSFPEGEDFMKIIAKQGFLNVKQHRQTFGIATIYEAIKKAD